ncbi:hypothetical protein PLESTF_001273600 [Pleodorina starrii]|nr:hypothetical protein PLESTF_001273600 [Pleodorina starrii]
MRCAVVQPFTSTCRIQCATATLVRQPLCRLPRQLTRTYAGDNEGPETSKASVDDGVLPPEEIKKLAALRRQQQAELSQDSNLLQGAVEEAQLITWPTREKVRRYSSSSSASI